MGAPYVVIMLLPLLCRICAVIYPGALAPRSLRVVMLPVLLCETTVCLVLPCLKMFPEVLRGMGYCPSLSWLGLLVGAGMLFMAVGVLAGHRNM